MKKITILGSTGSIGCQALEVIAAHKEQFCVSVLTTNRQTDLLEEQIEKFKPKMAVIVDEISGKDFREKYTGKTKIYIGKKALIEAAKYDETDIVLNALVGAAGIEPTLAAIFAGKNIALANKETLVAAGEIVIPAAAEKNVKIIPVDSEHSAIFQCLWGQDEKAVNKIILTASGGSFRSYSAANLKKVKVSECLQHPNWTMGQKVTIDSATMFDKGLEVIEAHWLFAVPYEKIEVLIQPQSIIHSMVEFIDGMVLAQLGLPDMKAPIQLAFTYPKRFWLSSKSWLNWKDISALQIELPNRENFPSLDLAYVAGKIGKTMPAVLNAANEVAVEAFLAERISFLQIFSLVEDAMNFHKTTVINSLQDIIVADMETRLYVQKKIKEINKEW